ncbi:two-component sensor histidine kinase [Paenibacillus sp. FSL A5-0031]|uniref:sensor histidine kinase n=1 Tax=Paenibacillus sp. FSL A5-0031 TaxID=1920420 RepID=UPI00096CFF2A|nr:sensor histidine kinase [Paenibacillus sp. FSL A5-0031]OME81424.1 two-component sensor histidine kinase [Paenibacillus sp. FSL A5-0031]
MVYSLVGIIVILAILNVIQYQMKRARSSDLRYIANQISRQLEQHSSEMLLLMTDDRELKLLLVELNRLFTDNQNKLAQFTKTNHSMRKMLANFSHDLKTPLTVVLGYAEMIQGSREMASEERERLLRLIHEKTLEIIKLMNGFFDLARLEAGDNDITLSRIHMNELCKKSILSFYDLVQASGYEADIQIPEEAIYALGNEEALERVLSNLLSNAIRYGSDGKRIGLAMSVDASHVRIDVSDCGKGIRARNQELVFERMFTLEESRNKAFQGSGLGLTITKRLVEEMNGEITLHSIPFEKTTFTVKLKRMTY